MGTNAWTISDSATPPPDNGGWTISDSPKPSKSKFSSTAQQQYQQQLANLPPVPGVPVPKGLQGPPATLAQRLTKPVEHSASQGVVGNAIDTLENLGSGLIGLPVQAYENLKNEENIPAPYTPAAFRMMNDAAAQQREHPVASAEQGIGALAGLGAVAEATPAVAAKLHNAALANPDEAALRGLRIGPSSHEANDALEEVHAVQPYVKGVKSQAQLQDALSMGGPVREEVWGPYQETVDSISGKPVKGPDGMTTVGDLENERLQLSAQLRTLKQGGPEAIALAQQKGLTQAGLLERLNAVEGSLDPELENAGIDPKLIRETYAKVGRLSGRIEGRNTLAESKEPSGVGKMLKPVGVKPGGILKLNNPFGGFRDIAAGRPWWSMRPTDVNLKEAFRVGGEKPNLGRFNPASQFYRKPLQLEESIPGRPVPQPVPSTITPVPEQVLQIPASTGGTAPVFDPEATSLVERLRAGAANPKSRFYQIHREPKSAPVQPIPARGTIAVSPAGEAVRQPAAGLPAPAQPPQLPASAGRGRPEQLQLTAGTGNPEFVTPQPTPPPALNEATARTRVQPNPTTRPEPVPQGTVQVSPEGTATVQRRALPPPETHAFSKSAWQEAHPNGNVATAVKLAEKKGYRIIE